MCHDITQNHTTGDLERQRYSLQKGQSQRKLFQVQTQAPFFSCLSLQKVLVPVFKLIPLISSSVKWEKQYLAEQKPHKNQKPKQIKNHIQVLTHSVFSTHYLLLFYFSPFVLLIIIRIQEHIISLSFGSQCEKCD